MRGFISYAHDDVGFLDRFRVHLTAVEQAFGVTFWSDDSLRAGHHWNDTIRDAINQADVFLLLVSPSTIASRYINEKEFPAIAHIRDRHATAISLFGTRYEKQPPSRFFTSSHVGLIPVFMQKNMQLYNKYSGIARFNSFTCSTVSMSCMIVL